MIENQTVTHERVYITDRPRIKRLKKALTPQFRAERRGLPTVALVVSMALDLMERRYAAEIEAVTLVMPEANSCT
jgi:hypothetical protein